MSFFVCLKVESIGEEDRIAGRKKNGKGGIRMKPKKFVQIYGKVVLPIIRGMTVRYFSNGTWKETARVRRVIEVTDAYIKFETDRIRYCINFGMVEDNAMPIAA